MHQKYRVVLHMFQIAKLVLDFLIIYSGWKPSIVSYSCYFSVPFLSSPWWSSSTPSLSPSTLSYTLSSSLSTTQWFLQFTFMDIAVISTVSRLFSSWYSYPNNLNFMASLYCYHERKPSSTNKSRQLSPMNKNSILCLLWSVLGFCVCWDTMLF